MVKKSGPSFKKVVCHLKKWCQSTQSRDSTGQLFASAPRDHFISNPIQNSLVVVAHLVMHFNSTNKPCMSTCTQHKISLRSQRLGVLLDGRMIFWFACDPNALYQSCSDFYRTDPLDLKFQKQIEDTYCSDTVANCSLLRCSFGLASSSVMSLISLGSMFAASSSSMSCSSLSLYSSSSLAFSSHSSSSL